MERGKVNQIWQINLQKSKDEKGIVTYILLSFPRVSLLYPDFNELFFQEQQQYSPHMMQEG